MAALFEPATSPGVLCIIVLAVKNVHDVRPETPCSRPIARFAIPTRTSQVSTRNNCAGDAPHKAILVYRVLLSMLSSLAYGPEWPHASTVNVGEHISVAVRPGHDRQKPRRARTQSLHRPSLARANLKATFDIQQVGRNKTHGHGPYKRSTPTIPAKV